MKRLAIILAVVAMCCPAFARQKYNGNCEQGGNTVSVVGLISTTKVKQSFPNCTVTVFLTGTNTLATIYSDYPGTALANPFTSNLDGSYGFYADDSRYDVRLSNAGIATPFTISDIFLQDWISGKAIVNFGIVNGVCNPVAQTGADMGAKINSCIAALPATGGEVRIPAGSYGGIATGIVISKSVRLIGAGTSNTVLTFNSNVTGITISPLVASLTLIEGLKLVGAGAATGTTGDGISARATHYLRDVYVIGFRGTGVKVLASTPSANSNIWMHENVFSNGNGGDGFSWSGTDVNAGSSINCSASDNLGIGFNDLGGGSMNNTFVGSQAANNAGGAWSIAGNSHSLLNPYIEQDGASTSKFVLTNTSYGVRVKFSRSAYPLTLTDNGANNQIEYWRTVVAVDTFNVPNFGFVPIKPSVTVSPTVYSWDSGSFDNTALSLRDQTNQTNLLVYYPSLGGGGWKFLKNLALEYAVPLLKLNDTTAGGHSYAFSAGSFNPTAFALQDTTAGVNYIATFPASAYPLQILQNTSVAGGKGIEFLGSTSGGNVIQAPAVSGNGALAFLPAFNSNDTLVLNNFAATFTNKAFDTAGGGNVFKINGVQITDNTGTGLNVLQTSPTLVTPNIGAATGTSLSVSGQFTSTVAIGTPPLVVTSTTNVPNLNASTLSGATFGSPGAIGGTTPGTGAFSTLTEAASKFTLDTNGKISTYNNVATAANGIAQVVAKVDATAQTANIGTPTLIYAVPATGAGFYRVSCYVVETVVGTTSSLAICQPQWTDNDTSTTQAQNITSTSAANVVGTNSAAVAGGSANPGITIVNAKASTNINYVTTGYASTGTAMQYSVHIKLEYLGN